MFNQDTGDYSPPTGWLEITDSWLRSIKPRTSLDEFFDGAQPEWEDILFPDLQPRAIIAEIVTRFQRRKDRSLSGMDLLRGPSGEGKSTVLFQATVALARSSEPWKIYWRYSPTAQLTMEDFVRLTSLESPIVFVADVAESLIPSLQDIFSSTHKPQMTAQLLLASRRNDWTRAHKGAGSRLDPVGKWRTSRFKIVLPDLGGLEPKDADLIVANWKNCSDSQPLVLARNGSERTSELLVLAAEGTRRSEGALLGGLLDLRIGPDGLRARVASLLERLDDVLYPKGKTLADLLLVLAALDLAELDGLREKLAAAYCGIPQGAVRAEIIEPVGREAIMGAGAQIIHARHPVVSAALMDEALSSGSTIPVEDNIDNLLELVAHHADEEGGYKRGDGYILDIGRRLLRARDRIKQRTGLEALLVGRCRKAAEVNPDQLNWAISQSSVMRDLGDSEGSIEELWNTVVPTLDRQDMWNDWSKRVRGCWLEFSTVLGVAARYEEGVWAAAISLSDRCDPARFSDKDLGAGLNQLAYNCLGLYRNTQSTAFSLAIATTKQVLETWLPSRSREIGYVRRYAREVRRTDPVSLDIDNVVRVLSDAAREAIALAVDSPYEESRGPLDHSLWSLRSELSRLAKATAVARPKVPVRRGHEGGR